MSHSLSRRGVLSAVALGLGGRCFAQTKDSHDKFGRLIKPTAPPPLALKLSDGTKTDLKTLLTGKTTAMQLMFTGCSATCPIQGQKLRR